MRGGCSADLGDADRFAGEGGEREAFREMFYSAEV